MGSFFRMRVHPVPYVKRGSERSFGLAIATPKRIIQVLTYGGSCFGQGRTLMQ